MKNKNLKRNGILIGLGIGIGALFLSWLKPVRESVMEKLNISYVATKSVTKDTVTDTGDTGTDPDTQAARTQSLLKEI